MMKKKQINVPYPANLPEKDRYLFEGLSYTIEHREVSYEKNVYVSKSGICLKKCRLLKASIHQQSKHYFFAFYKIAIGSFFFYKRKKLANDEEYLVIHNLWTRGYYHWICEALPRLWQVKDKLKNYILLLPENYQNYHLQTLQPYQFKSIQYFPPKTGFVVKNLVLPPNQDRLYEIDPESCEAIRDFYYSQTDKALINQFNFGERIYVSRRKTKRRVVANEEEIEGVLHAHGFKIIFFEEYNFWEQVAMMYHTRYLISIHGAGLTNMQFMKPGGKILELYKKRVPKVDFGKGRQNDLPSPCYCRLASVTGHQHYIQFCEAVDDRISSGNADLVVDKNIFENNIQVMLSATIPFMGQSRQQYQAD